MERGAVNRLAAASFRAGQVRPLLPAAGGAKAGLHPVRGQKEKR